MRKIIGAVKFLMVGVVVVLLINANNNLYKDAVQKCVNAGNSQSYCENSLR